MVLFNEIIWKEITKWKLLEGSLLQYKLNHQTQIKDSKMASKNPEEAYSNLKKSFFSQIPNYY